VPPLRFALQGRIASLQSERCESLGKAVAIAPVSMERGEDRQAVVTLATRCRSAEVTCHPAPPGLLAELSGRPGRVVLAWFAWPAAAARVAATGVAVDDCPLGLVALVVAGAVPQQRFTIAWLLVHPEARRRGIATALVAHAVAHAESLDATQVSAETLSSWPAAVGFWRSIGRVQES